MIKLKNLKVKMVNIAVALSLLLPFLFPSKAYAIEYSSTLNTPSALGSPLLNENTWEESDWNKWETVAFGVFLSNFAVPLLDDYNSAFQSASGIGSKGVGLKALQYGSGNDSQANKVLTNLLSLAIKDQAQGLQQIKVRYHSINSSLSDSLTGELTDDGAEAKLKDMFVNLYDEDSANIFGGNEPSSDESYLKRGVVGGEFKKDQVKDQKLRLYYLSEAKLPQLYIVSGGKPIQVFDLSDGYDAQMFSLSIARSASSDYGEEVMNNIESLMDLPIGLDVYGNICVQSNGRNIVVVPASSNQYLTKEKQYNLLTSNFMLGSYLRKTGDNLISSIASYRTHLLSDATFYSGDSIANSSEDSDDLGKVIMYNDTDIPLYSLLQSKITEEKDFKAVCSDYLNGDIDYDAGEELYKLVNTDITENKIGYPFKVDVIGAEGSVKFFDKLWKKLGNASGASSKKVRSAVAVGSLIATLYPTKSTNNVLNYMITVSGKSTLFGSADRQYFPAGGSYDTTGDDVFLKYGNFALKYIDNKNKLNISGDSGFEVFTQDSFANRVRSSKTAMELAEAIFTNISPVQGNAVTGDSILNGLLIHWLVNESGFQKGKSFNTDKLKNMRAKDIFEKGWFKTAVNSVRGYETLDDMQNSFYRTGAIFGFNSSAITASNVLNVVDGTEFASFTPYIYLTYLDFYGVYDKKSEFNPELFTGDLLARTGEEIAKGAVLSSEEKKALLEDYVYNILDPDTGGKYTTKLINKFVLEFLHDNYKKIVFGSTDGYIASSISSSGDEGFLRINTVTENMFIGGLARSYAQNFLVVFAVLLLIAFISAIFSGGGIFRIVGITVSFAFLMAFSPTVVDLVPTVMNRVVQGMYSDNMTYWAIAESIDNDRIDISSNEGVDKDKEVNSFIRMLNISQYDKTIMIKNDISKKIVEQIPNTDMAKLQRMKTTKWLFPILMRQFTANNGSAEYVSVTLSDTYRNMHNLYWLYRDSTSGGDKIKADLTNNNTYSAKLAQDLGIGVVSNALNNGNILSLSDKQSLYGGYASTKGTGTELDHHAVNRFNGEDNVNLHTTFYLLNFGSRFKVPNPSELGDLGTNINKFGYNKDTWNEYAEYLATSGSSKLGFMKSLVDITDNEVLPTISKYNSYNMPVYSYFGYLWMTENPMPYFYINVKDTFNQDMSVGKLAYELQGYYADIENANGEVVEKNAHFTFMRDARNGKLRDFMDMEEFFTNVLPYMYNVQIIAGGTGKHDGAFGLSDIGDDYSIYKANKKDWLFRSNWVTKIEEGDIFNKKEKIGYKDSAGDKHTAEIVGSLNPKNYEAYRPMIFSESQMVEMGLTKADLSYTETQILKFNRDVEKEWTMLLNYVNSDGMKADVLYRQMALSATLQFSKKFSTSTFQEKRTLYPFTLDLRNMSFDSVMKLLYMGSTHNASVLYKDTMRTVLEDGDLFSGIILLTNAIACSKAIPIVRDFALAFVTCLLVLKTVLDIITSKQEKAKYLLGTAFIYMKACFYTFIFFGVFKFLLLVSSPSQILSSVRNTGVTHNAWWYNLLIFAGCVWYIYTLVWNIIRFTWINRRDMGLEASLNSLSDISSALTGGFGGLSSTLGNLLGGSTERSTYDDVDRRKEYMNDAQSNSLGNNQTGFTQEFSSGNSSNGANNQNRDNSSQTRDFSSRDFDDYNSYSQDTSSSSSNTTDSSITESINESIERGKRESEYSSEKREESANSTNTTSTSNTTNSGGNYDYSKNDYSGGGVSLE